MMWALLAVIAVAAWAVVKAIYELQRTIIAAAYLQSQRLAELVETTRWLGGALSKLAPWLDIGRPGDPE